MRSTHAWPFLFIAVVLATARCAGPGTQPGPASDIPASSSAAAKDCAARLPPAAAIIYQDAEADVHASTNMESLLRVKVMMLIVRDKIKRAEARPAAEKAAACLEMLQR